jgi:hypothetical protein
MGQSEIQTQDAQGSIMRDILDDDFDEKGEYFHASIRVRV